MKAVGYEHQTLECLGCQKTERRLAFSNDRASRFAENPRAATAIDAPTSLSQIYETLTTGAPCRSVNLGTGRSKARRGHKSLACPRSHFMRLRGRLVIPRPSRPPDGSGTRTAAPVCTTKQHCIGWVRFRLPAYDRIGPLDCFGDAGIAETHAVRRGAFSRRRFANQKITRSDDHLIVGAVDLHDLEGQFVHIEYENRQGTRSYGVVRTAYWAGNFFHQPGSSWRARRSPGTRTLP